MKVSLAIAALVGAGLIAADKKPEDVKAALVGALALDKKAKDEAKEKDDADCAAAAKDAGCEPKDMVKGADGKWTKDTAGNDLPGREKAKDKKAADADDPDMGDDAGVNAPLETPKPSPGLDAKAMDAAVKLAVDAALAAERVKSEALFAARKDVEKVLGTVAYDSAEAVYGAALTHLKVDHKDVPASAFRALFHASVKTAPATPVTTDAATVKTMEQAFPGFDRLRR